MNLRQGTGDGGLQSLIRFHTPLHAGGGFGAVEIFAGKRIGEVGESSPIVDGGLGSLGFQFIENAGHLDDLFFVQAQLVSQEPQRPANAEAFFRRARSVTAMMSKAHKFLIPATGAGVSMLV